MANLTGALNLSSTGAMVTSWSPYVTDAQADLLNTTDDGITAPPSGNVIVVDETYYPMIVYSFVDKVLVIVVMPIIFTIGVLGNSAVIIAFFRYLYMRTVTNHYLINLAVADLTFLLFSVPQFWVQYLTTPIIGDYTYLPPEFCKISIFLTDSAVIASGLIVILVTFERYIATCWPFRFRRFSTKRRTIWLCALVWFFSLTYKIPSLIFAVKTKNTLIWHVPLENASEGLPQSIEYCEYCHPRNSVQCVRIRKTLTFDQLLLLSVIPITCVLYTLTMIQLQRSAKSAYVTVLEGATSNVLKKQVVRMLIVTIVVYIICITPFRILNLINIYDHVLPPNLIWIFVNIARIMIYTNSAVNPFIYNIMSERYRKAFKDIFIFCWPCCPKKRKMCNNNGSVEIEMKLCRLPSDRRYV
ncbi:D(2) dopamine receptor-like isoform X2 [Acanthaster planci]|nr:D(2) dopamine receptor-like isoform X2 [Acanthaster planci]XP_022109961.1 D(2) dopamine receptor-like isoform X2 [Acanthaster planci]XP_022109962.1 D(2) dopamine receptor-like isoform X2 [Acanthaster planci]XP_022109963.1 D(2) dopamine receptor-like isoform X2 [Acanthaster planci]XP_022109964.1 D(2) dopamine receptor-like isoform X2 [Acanthaster planci]